MAFERLNELSEEDCEFFGVNKFLKEEASNHIKARFAKKPPQEPNGFTCSIDREHKVLLTQNLKIGGGMHFTYYTLLWDKQVITFLTERGPVLKEQERYMNTIFVLNTRIPTHLKNQYEEVLILIEQGFLGLRNADKNGLLIKFPLYRKEDKDFVNQHQNPHRID